ncbi:MAG TPA: RNA-binding protein, partial [Anaerolineales bacterium]
LPWEATDKQLTELFAKAGTVVSAEVKIDKFSGKSKGFGFVEMSTDEEAAEAIKTLNGSEMGGRQLKVDEARPPVERGDRFGGGGYGGGYGGGQGGHGGGFSQGSVRGKRRY